MVARIGTTNTTAANAAASRMGERRGRQDQERHQVQDPAERHMQLDVLRAGEQPQPDEEDLDHHPDHESPGEDEEDVARGTDPETSSVSLESVS